MDPNNLITFGIPAVTIGVMVYRRLFKPAAPASEATALATGKIAQDVAAATDAAPLATRQWLDYVNGQPDVAPHLGVIGGSGSGKTTLTTAVLHDRPGQIVVITGKEGDDWGGLPYVGIDVDATYTTANQTFAAICKEVKQRLIAVKQKRFTADWLTIVLDDFSVLRSVCDEADEPFKIVARIGRSLRVRLIVLSDTASVKAWGIEGEGETRANFAFIRTKRNHAASLEIDEKQVPIDTSLLARVAAAAQLAPRAWKPVRNPVDELADLIGVRPSSTVGENASQTQEGRMDGRTDDEDDATPSPGCEALIKALASQKIGRDGIREAVKAAGFRISNKRLSTLMNE